MKNYSTNNTTIRKTFFIITSTTIFSKLIRTVLGCIILFIIISCLYLHVSLTEFVDNNYYNNNTNFKYPHQQRFHFLGEIINTNRYNNYNNNQYQYQQILVRTLSETYNNKETDYRNKKNNNATNDRNTDDNDDNNDNNDSNEHENELQLPVEDDDVTYKKESLEESYRLYNNSQRYYFDIQHINVINNVTTLYNAIQNNTNQYIQSSFAKKNHQQHNHQNNDYDNNKKFSSSLPGSFFNDNDIDNHNHNIDHISSYYNIYDCPYIVPNNYPFSYNIVNKILNNWNPNNVTILPNKIYNTLCIFNWTNATQRTNAYNYQKNEVPFIIKNYPKIIQTSYRWIQSNYIVTLLQNISQQRTEMSLPISKNYNSTYTDKDNISSTAQSNYNHFMYWNQHLTPQYRKQQQLQQQKGRRRNRRRGVSKNDDDDEDSTDSNWQPPTLNTKLTFEQWHEKAIEIEQYYNNIIINNNSTNNEMTTNTTNIPPLHPEWYYYHLNGGYSKSYDNIQRQQRNLKNNNNNKKHQQNNNENNRGMNEFLYNELDFFRPNLERRKRKTRSRTNNINNNNQKEVRNVQQATTSVAAPGGSGNNNDYATTTTTKNDNDNENNNNIFIINTKEVRGINCRFGMKGIIAENHFDSTRNWIVLLKGLRRYILVHPSQCSKLQLYPLHHPSGRHSSIDWSNYTSSTTSSSSSTTESFDTAVGNEIILQAGDALYLPTYWFHYIVSLTYNYQCNARSGFTTENNHYISQCGFPTSMLG